MRSDSREKGFGDFWGLIMIRAVRRDDGVVRSLAMDGWFDGR